MTRRALSILVTLVAGLLLTPLAAHASEQANDRPSDVIPGRYIVTYRPSVDRPGRLTGWLAERVGFDDRLRYHHAVKGFSAALTIGEVEELRQDPRVAFVVPDREVHAVGATPLATGETVPTGVRRIEAATTTEVHGPSSVHVAVIDSGVDLSHSDLNAVDGKNCVGSGPATDDNGHGTHVAGSIGAENDGAGVVGVAPGTRVYAVKVLDSAGSGTWSQIICGIDWVTGTRTDADASNDIAVANMSLGGAGSPIKTCATTTDPLHKAICNSTAAGVTYVVAAGNDGWDFDYATQPDVPAAYPEVLTVTAVSDSDGQLGATGGSPSCRTSEKDDTYASFSNYAATSAGAAHTVAGPGVCILSDKAGGGTVQYSGTSMAAPHLAGLVALCLGEDGATGPCTGLTPADIIQKIRTDARDHSSADPSYGFTGDPAHPVSGRYYGYMGWVGITSATPPPADTTAPTVTSVSPSDGNRGVATSVNVTATFDEAMDRSATQAAFRLGPTAGGSAVSGSFSWSDNTMTFDPSSSLAQGTSYTARIGTGARDAAGNPLASEVSWSFSTLTNVTQYPSGASVLTGTLRSGDASRLSSDNNAYYEVNSTTGGTTTTAFRGSFTGVSNELSGLKITYKGRNSRSAAQTVAIWNWSTGAWIQLDSRSVGDSEVLIEKSPSESLGDYVSGTSGDGELLVRIRATRSTYSFYARGDLMRIAYTRP